MLNNCFQIPFDLKITKLEGENWERENIHGLAQQLYDDQGECRESIENRITIVFDRSTTSSVSYFKKHKPILLYRLITECYEAKNWVWVTKHKVWHCVVMIPEIEDTEVEYSEHIIGYGLREKEKADFEYELLNEVAECSNGIMTVNPNKKEHGVDGWIWLPNSILRLKK